LFTTDSSQQGRVTQWDAATLKELRRFDEPPYGGPALVRHGCPCLLRNTPSGKDQSDVLATFGHEQGQVKKVCGPLGDVQTGKPRRAITGIGGTAWVSALALSPDGNVLAWASESGQLRLHDLKADKQRFQMDAQLLAKSFVLDCVFSPDGKTLATQLT